MTFGDFLVIEGESRNGGYLEHDDDDDDVKSHGDRSGGSHDEYKDGKHDDDDDDHEHDDDKECENPAHSHENRSTILLQFSVTDPGSDDINISIDWGDGSSTEMDYLKLGDPDMNTGTPEPAYPTTSTPDVYPRTIPVSLEHTYGSNGEFNITITATDDDGGNTEEMVVVHITGYVAGTDDDDDFDTDSISEPLETQVMYEVSRSFGDRLVTFEMEDEDDELENGGTDTFVITAEGAKGKIYFLTKENNAGSWKSMKLKEGEEALDSNGFMLKIISIGGDVYTIALTGQSNTDGLESVSILFSKNSMVTDPVDDSEYPAMRT